jgi:hypothetical protein
MGMKVTYLYSALAMALIIFGVHACDYSNKPDADSTTLIAGDSTKAWRLKKEVNDNGLREKTTDEEKEEMIVFETNNSFYTKSPVETRAGSWTYSNDSLTLQFYNSGEMRVYVVEDLNEKKMRWRASDETEYVLTTK